MTWRRIAVLAGTTALIWSVAAGAAGADQSPEPDPGVAAYQEALAEAGFYRGPIDGLDGPMTRAAVLSFEKAAGLERDGEWVPLHSRHLANLDLDGVGRGEAPDRLEIDLTNQVAYLYREGALSAVLGVSTGNDELYAHPAGRTARASTPRGDFAFYKYVDGLRRAPLGVLYKPWYFRGGFALHGSPSVPAYPASHGCVRVTMWDADWLADHLTLRMPVHIWEGPRAEPPALSYQTPVWLDSGTAVHPI